MAVLLPVNLGSRPDVGYALWLDKHITFGWISYKVIRIRAKKILAQETENILLYWEVRTSWPYCFEELLLIARDCTCGHC